MPARGIRGGKLAQEILRISEQLEGDFRREFLDEVASYANNPVLKKLLKDIDSGSFTAGSSLSSSLANITFASSRLDALARKAMGRSARITAKTTTGFELSFNVINPEVVAIARTMSINLSTSLNKSTRETLRKIIQDAVEGNLTTIQAARKIRTHVGLIPKHADAVDRYYETLIQSGVKTKLAQKQADAYAQRLLKYRSETIARTEIARAVGEGQTAMWKQMVADGYLPVDAKRVWVTALDERTCEICEPMNGVETDIFGSWNTPNGFVSHPQATHPNCRCTQGIIMPKSKVGKSDELELNQWLLSKLNPYHDELGRFTFAPDGARTSSGKPSLSDWQAYNGYDDKARQIASQVLRGGNQEERLFDAPADNPDDKSKLFVGEDSTQPTEFIKSMYEVSHGGLTSRVIQVEFNESYGVKIGEPLSGSLQVRVVVEDSDGGQVGHAERTLTISDGQLLEVEHDSFSIDKGDTGSGFGAVFFSNAVSHYEEVGAMSVITHANIDVGGYAWAKAGFQFQYASSIVEIGEMAYRTALLGGRGLAATFLEKMTSGSFRDVDSVNTSSRLSENSKKKIIKSLEQAEKQLDKSMAERVSFAEGLENGEHLADGNNPEYPMGYTPQKFAGIGKENSVKILVPVQVGGFGEYELKEVEMWLGKAVMLQSSWGAVLPLSGMDWEPLKP